MAQGAAVGVALPARLEASPRTFEAAPHHAGAGAACADIPAVALRKDLQAARTHGEGSRTSPLERQAEAMDLLPFGALDRGRRGQAISREASLFPTLIPMRQTDPNNESPSK
mmetsp:Transcript_1362/g.3781  ORF Transcript_1362/g.3781 Transcript_1362/m.3781 type:complete len:112 (-) Transcript_1362:1091-1426(-)